MNPDWTGKDPHVVIEGTGAQVITDVQNCQLPAVTWVIPDGPASDHARGNNGLGPSWVASIVNQIGDERGLCRDAAKPTGTTPPSS